MEISCKAYFWGIAQFPLEEISIRKGKKEEMSSSHCFGITYSFNSYLKTFCTSWSQIEISSKQCNANPLGNHWKLWELSFVHTKSQNTRVCRGTRKQKSAFFSSISQLDKFWVTLKHFKEINHIHMNLFLCLVFLSRSFISISCVCSCRLTF